MSYRVIIQPPALENIESAYLRAAQHAPETALRWLERVSSGITDAQDEPNPMQYCAGERCLQTRSAPFFYRTKSRHAYRALFTIQDNEVCVLHVRAPGQRLMQPGEL